MQLLRVDTVEQTKNKIDRYFADFQGESEEIDSMNALGRILAEDVYAAIDLPEFHRSTVDGYAVVAGDTFGVSESLPTFLEVIGKVVMGEATELEVSKGETVYVPTGGMIPDGADAVVMIEYVEHLDDHTIAVYRSVAPGDGIILKGEDIKKGEKILSKGKKIKPQDIGALASVGINSVKVFRRPKVAILSTGDEIVDPRNPIKFGQVRDINTYSLTAMVEELGGEITYKDIIKDDYSTLKSTMESLIDGNDIVIVSGGSSVGTKDVTAKVIDALGEPGVFVHGVAIKPGKPTIVGKIRNTAVFGLPGHPVSAMIVFKIFVEHLINKMLSQTMENKIELMARTDVNIHSSPGKETYQMVVLEERDGEYIAKPIHGKSGAITLMTKAHGFIKIATNKEGVKKGEKVKVTLL